MQQNLSAKHIILPVMYYFSLSFGLLFVSMYWLVNGSGDIAKSNAQGFTQEESDFKINLSATNKELIVEKEITESKNKYGCDIHEGKIIDAFFESKKAPLAGHGCRFASEAKTNEISPYLIPAISWCESNGGQSLTSQAFKNPFGWGINDSASTRNDDIYIKDSLEASIEVVTRRVAGKTRELGYEVVPSEIVKWYNKGSVDRADGISENSTWAKCVDVMSREIQKSPI